MDRCDQYVRLAEKLAILEGIAMTSNKEELPAVAVFHQALASAGLWDIYNAARGICRPILFFDQSVAGMSPEMIAAAEEMFPVVVYESSGLVSAVKDAGVQGVTTFHDGELENVDIALAAIGFPGVSEIDHPWDKLAQRQALAAAGLSNIAAVAVDSIGGFRKAIERVGWPAVLKPRRAAGGSGLAFIDDSFDVDHQMQHRTNWANLVLEAKLSSAGHPAAGWLADFVSVETVSTGDARHHVAIFDKAPVSVSRRAGADGADALNVTGDVTPTRLPDGLRDSVLDYTERVLDTLGVRWRVTHTEIRLSAHGPELIEVNGRVGGHLPRLLHALDGPNLYAMALQLSLGQKPDVPPLPTGAPCGYAMGLFPAFRSREGRVRSHVTRAELRELPGVVSAEEVSTQGAPRRATGYRATNLVLRAADAAEMDSFVAETAAGVSRLFAEDGFQDDPWFDNFR